MNVAILQQSVEYTGSIDAICKQAIAHADEAIEHAEKADLFILPELFTTGGFRPLFSLLNDNTNRSSFADKVHQLNNDGLCWMKAKSHDTVAAVCGSMICEENGSFFNRLYFVKPDGEITTYDKRHLFHGAGEEKVFTGGKNRSVVTYLGFRFLLQICYDLRFPAFSRYHNDYDAIIYVANWPASRQEAWKTLLCARAIENQSYVLGANCVGNDGQSNYGGTSCIFDAYGHNVAIGSSSNEEVITASLELEEVQAFRKKFPVYADADDFVIIDTAKQTNKDICYTTT